jgi:hypothetical protein
MTALEYFDDKYPNNLPQTPENPYGIDPRNWIIYGLPSISLTGAVTGTLDGNSILTKLSQEVPIDGKYTVYSFKDTGEYGVPYYNSFSLPSNESSPIYELISQTGSSSGANPTLRKCTISMYQGLSSSIQSRMDFSIYHSLLPNTKTITPLSLGYSIADSKAKLDVFGILDLNNNPIKNIPDPVNDKDPTNKLWVENLVAGGGGGAITLTGSVTGSGTGTVATTLSAAQNLPSKFLHLNYEDTGIYGDPYFLSNFLPINDPEPILRFVTQTGSSSSQTLRRWDMNFKTGLGNSVTNEFELSMYHSLLPGNSVTPLRISYSIADSSPVVNIAGLLDIGNNNARSTASPISVYHLANKGYVDYTVATYPLNLLVPTGDVDLGVYRIASSSTPVISNHLTNKNYVDNKPLNSFPVNSDVDLGVYKMSSSTAPTQGNHFCNKTYVDSNTIGGNIRTGNVIVGDIGGTTGTVALTVSGAIISATKRNGYSNSDSFIDITFSNKSYIPFVFVTINNNMGNSNSNDIALPVTILNTSTSARIYLEETVSTFQSVYLGILLINPNLS